MARVLLVDDDEAGRTLIARALQVDGHAVTAVSDGQEALRAAGGEAGRFDLVITDVEMPGLDGITLAERLKAQEPGLRILLVSGFESGLSRATALASPTLRLLAKPISIERLRAAIAEMLA